MMHKMNFDVNNFVSNTKLFGTISRDTKHANQSTFFTYDDDALVEILRRFDSVVMRLEDLLGMYDDGGDDVWIEIDSSPTVHQLFVNIATSTRKSSLNQLMQYLHDYRMAETQLAIAATHPELFKMVSILHIIDDVKTYLAMTA